MSFWESFCNIFNLFPERKTYQQLSDELDERMQKLYEDNGWGEYVNPLKTCSYPTTNPAYNTAYTDPKEFLEEMLKQVPSDPTKLNKDEINAIYCCISFAQDLRDAFDEGLVEGKWDKEGDDESKRDWLNKNIAKALIAAHKLAGYDAGVLSNKDTKGKNNK